MKLRKQDQEFRNPKVFYADPKNIDLDRVLVNLFLLLRCDGQRPASRGRQQRDVEKVEYHAEQLAGMPGVSGFKEHPEIAKAWLESDIFDLVNRGGAKEAVASLRPLHLDAHKIRVAKHCRDYNHADALYALLEHGDLQALADLKAYLDRGRSPHTDEAHLAAQVDLETLTVIKLVEDLPALHRSGEKVTQWPPTCVGQARVLGDDILRLLSYQDEVPRPVMIEYLKTIMGLHLGQYVLRLRRQLSGWIEAKMPNSECITCPVHGTAAKPFAQCPHKIELTVDMGSDFRSRMAQLAQASTSEEYGRLSDLVRAIFTMNQLLRYAKDEKGLNVPDEPFEVLRLLRDPPEQFDPDFRAALKELRRLNEEDDATLTQEEEAIFAAGLPPFETFIELVTHSRQKHHVNYLTQDLDKLFQKNSDWGALAQGRSKVNPRRWQLGGRLLEVLVQLAVLQVDEGDGKRTFYSEPVLIDDFLHWLERRYGFVVGPPLGDNGTGPVRLEEHRAFRDNIAALKDRLREIGFYDDLSDAYNAQRIRPRYPIARSRETAK